MADIEGNTADPKFHEEKKRHGGSDIRVADLFSLSGRTIVVTGAAGYLGRELTGAILEAGGDVVGLDIVPTPKAETWKPLEELAAKLGRQLSYYVLDQTKSDAIDPVFAQFVPKLKTPLRGLVAAAGLSDGGPAQDFPVERFRRLMELNVIGTFAVAQAVAKEMQKANVSGSMVLVASMSGTVTNRGVDTAAYNTSKSGVLQLTRSLAAEWGSRKGMPLIRVNSLSPGYILTVATEKALGWPGIREQWVSDNMLYRLSHVDEYRGPVLYLLSDASSFMTAADLRVDGGHCAW